MTIEKQNAINLQAQRPARSNVSAVAIADEGCTELCFSLPPCIAEGLTAYVADTGGSWDDASARAIALLLMQTGYAGPEVSREYLRLAGLEVAA
jgi:hypothetical protein